MIPRLTVAAKPHSTYNSIPVALTVGFERLRESFSDFHNPFLNELRGSRHSIPVDHQPVLAHLRHRSIQVKLACDAVVAGYRNALTRRPVVLVAVARVAQLELALKRAGIPIPTNTSSTGSLLAKLTRHPF